MEAVAKHDFYDPDEEYLSFKKGSILKILVLATKLVSAIWVKAEQDGREGLIPLNYVNMKPHEWFVPDITRQGAEDLLKDKFDGAFLIRDSEATPGDFSLSVKYGNGVQHFKVLRDGAGKYFLWVVKFKSLNALVEYHRTSSVSRSQQIFLKDGLPDDMDDELNLTKVLALYDFEAADEEELSFEKGDVILVVEKIDSNWWEGVLLSDSGTETFSKGMFPVPYVKVFE